MNSEMTKMKAVIMCFAAVLMVVNGIIYIQSKEHESSKTVETSTTQQIKTAPTKETSESIQTKETENSQVQEENKKKDMQLIQLFSDKWLNYNDIYERNQSVKEYLTMECIEENAINVDPKVEYKAKGSVLSINKNLDTEGQYVVMGTEEAKGHSNSIIITIDLDQAQMKIASFKIYYIQSGY